MRLRHIGACLSAALLLNGCQADSSSARLETEAQKASYGVGLNMGRNLVQARGHIDMRALRRGIEDAMAERDPAIPQEEIQMALDAFSDTIRKEQQAEHAAQAEKNEQEGGEYRKQNAAKAGVTVTASGLQYEVLEPGDGPKPTAEDRVRIHYRGTLVDGTEFDSSYERGEPAEFGVGGVVKGFGEALQLMSVGSKYRIVLPPELAYGSQGSGGTIGPNATLIFELELLEIVE